MILLGVKETDLEELESLAYHRGYEDATYES